MSKKSENIPEPVPVSVFEPPVKTEITKIYEGRSISPKLFELPS